MSKDSADTDWSKVLEDTLAEMAAEARELAKSEEVRKELFELSYTILEARIAKKLTQTELARLTGMEHTAIARLENGRNNPTYLTLVRVAKALDRKLDFGVAQADDIADVGGNNVQAEPNGCHDDVFLEG